jgi:hypothetical protein
MATSSPIWGPPAADQSFPAIIQNGLCPQAHQATKQPINLRNPLATAANMASRTSHALFELLNVLYLIAFNLAYLAAASVQGLDAVLCWVGCVGPRCCR